MKKWLVALLFLVFLSGSAYANERSLTFITGASPGLKMATGPLRLKQIIVTPTANNAYVLVEDSLTDVRTDIKLDIRGPGTNDKVTRSYDFGNDEDFLLMYDGVYAVISNATVTLVILGDGLTTVTNGGSTTKTKRDPQTSVTYSITAGNSATVRDSFAVWWGKLDSDLTLSAN